MISTSGHELAVLLEKLPTQLQQISSTTVQETMGLIVEERKNIVQELSGESRKIIDHIFLLACVFVIIAVVIFFGAKFVYQAALNRTKLVGENKK
jgi:hypothetical protein